MSDITVPKTFFCKPRRLNHGLCKQIAITGLLVESIAEWQMLIAIQASASSHLILGLILLVISYFPKAPFLPLLYLIWKPSKHAFLDILEGMGFRQPGVKKKSYAAMYQSKRYGPTVPRDSWFAKYQSLGAYGERKFPSEYDEDTLEKLGFWWSVVGWALFIRALNHLAAAWHKQS